MLLSRCFTSFSRFTGHSIGITNTAIDDLSWNGIYGTRYIAIRCLFECNKIFCRCKHMHKEGLFFSYKDVAGCNRMHEQDEPNWLICSCEHT